jgi:hypothetical protein
MWRWQPCMTLRHSMHQIAPANTTNFINNFHEVSEQLFHQPLQNKDRIENPKHWIFQSSKPKGKILR